MTAAAAPFEPPREATREPPIFLERALLFTFACHGIGMLTMALLLLPGMPGGGTADDAERVAYVASGPWRWRLGWLPWQLTALSDVAIGVAMVQTAWIPRGAAWAVLILTIAAVIPDQLAQAIWVTDGIDLAAASVAAGDLSPYLLLEARIFPWTAYWGAVLYTLGAIGWSIAFARAGTWSRTLTWLSTIAWSVFLTVTAGPLLLPTGSLSPDLVAAGNALGFVALLVWLVLVSDEVMKVSRPETQHGRYAPWIHPRRGLKASVITWAARSRFLRALGELVPVVAFRSDITNVVYVNYLVEASRLERLLPAGLELQRIGENGRFALFTVLTYRHGHLGPRLLGPLRRILPSPIQSNWRIYVRNPKTGHEGVYFVTTAISSTLHALAARMLAEGLPMHVPAFAEVRRDGHDTLQVVIDPGEGSAPDVRATLRPAASRTLDAPWSDCFPDYDALLAYAVPQDRALSTQPRCDTVTRQEIHLGIPLEACEPLEGNVASDAARAIVGETAPLCFRVAKVAFVFAEEVRDAAA